MLLQYRTTPHRMTGQTPTQLLFNRELKTKIPSLTSDIVDTQGNYAVTRQTDAQAKEKAKKYTDEKRHASPRNLKTGDLVLVSQRKQNKYSTRFCKDPLDIKEIRGTQLILTDIHGKQQRRNSSHVRKYWTQPGSAMPHTEDDDSPIPVSPHRMLGSQPAAPTPSVPLMDPHIHPRQASNQSSPERSQTGPTLRRSTRNKRTPQHLNDYAV